ncbi:homoserine kinase, partial [Lactococcus lactis]|nr:homoserine kinase [Lactococcus lactis]
PTVMLLLPDDKLNLLTEKINEQNLSGQLYSLEVDSNGLQVEESVL